MPGDQQVFDHRHVRHQLAVLEGARQPEPGDGMRPARRELLPVEIDATARRSVDAADAVEHAGLAGAVGTDQAQQLAVRVANDTPAARAGRRRPADVAKLEAAAQPYQRRLPPVLLDVAVAALPFAAEAEVELADVRMPAQLVRGAGEHDAAVLQHVGVVGDIERHRGVLLDQQYRHPELAADHLQASDQLLDSTN